MSVWKMIAAGVATIAAAGTVLTLIITPVVLNQAERRMDEKIQQTEARIVHRLDRIEDLVRNP